MALKPGVRAWVLICIIASSPLIASQHIWAKKSSESVTCTNPETHNKYSLRVETAEKLLDTLEEHLEDLHLNVLDLPSRARFEADQLKNMKRNKDWCGMRLNILAIEDMLKTPPTLTEMFVAEKYARVERWCKDNRAPYGIHDKYEKLLRKAAKQIRKENYDTANELLEEAGKLARDKRAAWDIPKWIVSLDRAFGADDDTAVHEEEVVAGCPKMPKEDDSTKEFVARTLNKMTQNMDKKNIRLFDLRGGEDLFTRLEVYTRLNLYQPALQIACILAFRVEQVKVDADFVMARFTKLNDLRTERSLEPDQRMKYTDMLMQASKLVSQREFQAAHKQIEALLIMLGEPEKPSGSFAVLPKSVVKK